MHIRILSSCTGEKQHSPPGQLTQNDFRALHDADFAAIEATLDEWRTPARDLYTGSQHLRLLQGIGAASGLEVTLDIVSAGYGLIEGGRAIVPYECTFATMKTGEIDVWAKHLRLPEAAREWFCAEADLNLVLLGDAYLRSLGLTDQTQFAAPTLFLTGEGARKWVKGQGRARAVALANADAKRFSFGLVGLKGEVARRLLPRLADGQISVDSLFDSGFDLKEALAPVQAAPEVPEKRVATAHPFIDTVIQIPGSWWDKPHRQKLRYFIPEWDDLVDPDYDFATDTHAGGVSDWSNEAYAHQLYPEPNYDGILISKVVAEKSKKKKERINRLGVHRFLRVPREFPIMGDCGAFGYIMEEKPPYTTDEMLDYYTRLDFDMGVSLDHLIVSATHEQRQARFDLTLHNADEFLTGHRAAGLGWTPIGAVQGWDPASYAQGAAAMVAMGYKYIALGGMVRSTTKEILRVLDAVHRVVPSDVQMHLFGLARLGAMADFARLGVTSVDSALCF